MPMFVHVQAIRFKSFFKNIDLLCFFIAVSYISKKSTDKLSVDKITRWKRSIVADTEITRYAIGVESYFITNQ